MSVGVIIGRFQVHELHDGHLELMKRVQEKHNEVIIFLGISNALVTKRNPLDFVTRKQMILNIFPNFTILPLKDKRDDHSWSMEIDQKVKEIHPLHDAILYGSRDSFIPFYDGNLKTKEIEQNFYISGTEIRNNLSEKIKSTSDFRVGVIYAAYNQYPIIHPTVDILIFRNQEILLAKKPLENKYRVIGGFVDPNDNSLEFAAKRESFEETKLELDNLVYLTSMKIDDWRYKNEDSKIITTLFSAEYIYGKPLPSDDISELRWFHIDNIDWDKDIIEEHQKLLKIGIEKKFNKNVTQNQDPTC